MKYNLQKGLEKPCMAFNFHLNQYFRLKTKNKGSLGMSNKRIAFFFNMVNNH